MRRTTAPGPAQLPLALALCLFGGSAFAAEAKPGAGFPSPTPPPTVAAAAVPALSRATLVEAWGRIIAEETHATEFGLNAAEQQAWVRGLERAASQLPPPQALNAIYNDVAYFLEERRSAWRAAQRRRNLEAAPAYFARLRATEGVRMTRSGLACEFLASGDDRKPTPDNAVVIGYRAYLPDGTEVDSTQALGTAEVALRDLPPGWREGLRLIGVGGRIRLHVPPSLGFSDEEALKRNIPPAAIVIAEIELKSIKPAAPQEPTPPPAPVPPPLPPAGFPREEVLATWGWITASERGVTQAALTAEERSHLHRGLAGALAGEAASFNVAAARPHVARFVAERRQAFQSAAKQRRQAESAAYFEKLLRQPGVVRLPSGVCYEVVRPGKGAYPRPDQRVFVNYVGRLLDGTIFDRTMPELGPLDIDLDKVIRGWTEGVQKINAGGIIRLHIPPDLAYGDAATGGIPPNSTLVFEIELLEIREIPR